jgi:lysophospholipase L1-like esterase
VAREENVEFLDLHAQFVDAEGNLDEALTTDGLHLSPEGYRVWRSQLEKYPPSPVPAAATPVKGNS